MSAKRIRRDDYDAIRAANENYAQRLRSQPTPTGQQIRARLANPPQVAVVTGKLIDPRLQMDSMDALENVIHSGASGNPTLAGEDQINAILASVTRGQHLPVAETQPWQSIVAKALRQYDFWFGSAPDRKSVSFELPPTDLDEYEKRWARRTPKATLFYGDNLPITHDDTDEHGDELPPWNPTMEPSLTVVVSTSRPGHRWLLRGVTTIHSVLELVSYDKHCDLAHECCTQTTKPSALNVYPFHHGDLIVITHVCGACWQQSADEQIPKELPNAFVKMMCISTPEID